MDSTLKIKFNTDTDRSYTMSIPFVQRSLGTDLVKTSIQNIVQCGVFTSKNGKLASAKEASIVDTTIQDIPL